MKILIVDDATENLAAAKEAAEGFAEHEFVFTNSAREAIESMETADGIITDLFFSQEGHGDGSELDLAYALYHSKMVGNPVFDEVVRKYYQGDRWRAETSLNEALALMENGTIRASVERLIKLFEGRGNREYAEKYRKRLQNLPAPQFPYGGALMLRAKELGKRHCLVSEIHRHASEFTNAADATDAMALLLPLMGEDIITVEQATYDGKDSLTYIAEGEIADAIYAADKSREQTRYGKTHPAAWTEAIRRLLAQ